MSQLKIILIDVAWGDSIFLEAIDNRGNESYALIDSNDSTSYKSTLIFLKKYLIVILNFLLLEILMIEFIQFISILDIHL